MQAAPTQKARPVGLKQPSSTDVDSTTPRGEEAKKAARMSAAEKAITPCMFFAYNACRAKSCAFLHSETNRYQGPPPRALGKGGKAPPNAYASVATVIIPEVAVSDAIKPVITAMPSKLPQPSLGFALLDHVLTAEDTPGCATCNTHMRHSADQRCAHSANTVEEKNRHKKGKKAPLNASTQRVKSDADAEPYARIRVGEELHNPIPSHLSLDSDEHHRIMHKGGPKLELPNPDVPSPSNASVSDVLIRSQVVSSASIPCRESLPGSNQPTGRTNRRHRKVAKNACNANAKPITCKFACSPDIQKLSASEHNGIPCDRLSRDNIELGNESQCGLLGNHIAELAETAPPLVWTPSSCSHTFPWQRPKHNEGLRSRAAAPLRKPSWHITAGHTIAKP